MTQLAKFFLFSVFVAIPLVFHLRTTLQPSSSAQRAALLRMQNLAKATIQIPEERLIETFRARHHVDSWQDVGFQRAGSPVSDFRGLGALAAHVMDASMSVYAREELGWGLLMINVAHQLLAKMAQSDAFLRQFDFATVAEFTKIVDFEVERVRREFGSRGVMEFNVFFAAYRKKNWR
ncbi:ELMO/CED-12 domain-containing protein [Spironucleus salmonicida]|uniref:ELMO/CED-12 domain-containing protein n=1 Tax=Spironucleus salmonicida TaxID=348837 RepID=V6LQW4_9EUKA|nr:ELMO/CED-12 domain-containing protein [Spironucleus salmonicida]|eukprot:EST43144.1 ELMO/CED-12 domain-containing protein [Spironucleus salmonicida]